MSPSEIRGDVMRSEVVDDFDKVVEEAVHLEEAHEDDRWN